jgi:hypothetical protein
MLTYSFLFLKEEEDVEGITRPAWDVERAKNFINDCEFKVEGVEENENVICLTVEKQPTEETETIVLPISKTVFLHTQHPRYSKEESAQELLKVLESELKKEEDKKIEVIDDSETSSSPDKRESQQDSSTKSKSTEA